MAMAKKDVKIVTGNGWEMHRGDCCAVMRGIDRVDHVITDPPYEIEAHTKQRRALSELPFVAISEAERSVAGALMGRLSRRWVITFCQAEAIAAWRVALSTATVDWVRAGVWIKPNGMPQFTGDRPGQGYESLAIAHKAGKKRWNGGGRHAVWTVPTDHSAGGGGKNDHPTTKPIALMLALVADFTDPGETILDPFAGSGTTGVAALRLGRRFVGVEKDAKYFDLCVERLRAEESGTTVRAERAGQEALFKVGA